MSKIESIPFVPILTVLAEYGNAPFLWIVERPDQGGVGPNICDGTCWDESYPLSEGLWQKFADWVIEFDRATFYLEYIDHDDWDWPAFHARGFQLATWLKEDVGEAYRVVYLKPSEDPNRKINERTEILADGTLKSLPPFSSLFPEPVHFCQHIVSGGQTGVDRAALDFAVEHEYTHGGWAPHGRMADDGIIALKYQLWELDQGNYRQRTRRNVEDSDATLIINFGVLDGGTLATQAFAENLSKPYLVVQLDRDVTPEAVASVVEWLRQNDVKTLNVAGPRESKRPGIYRMTRELLHDIDHAIRAE
jgi:hypothetical protein